VRTSCLAPSSNRRPNRRSSPPDRRTTLSRTGRYQAPSECLFRLRPRGHPSSQRNRAPHPNGHRDKRGRAIHAASGGRCGLPPNGDRGLLSRWGCGSAFGARGKGLPKTGRCDRRGRFSRAGRRVSRRKSPAIQVSPPTRSRAQTEGVLAERILPEIPYFAVLPFSRT
jgi:hypothetical protein